VKKLKEGIRQVHTPEMVSDRDKVLQNDYFYFQTYKIEVLAEIKAKVMQNYHFRNLLKQSLLLFFYEIFQNSSLII
jgi:hypothetical protein